MALEWLFFTLLSIKYVVTVYIPHCKLDCILRIPGPHGQSWWQMHFQESPKQGSSAICARMKISPASVRCGSTYPPGASKPRPEPIAQECKQGNIAPASMRAEATITFCLDHGSLSLLPGLPASTLASLVIHSPSNSKTGCFKVSQIMHLLAYNLPMASLSQRIKLHTCELC